MSPTNITRRIFIEETVSTGTGVAMASIGASALAAEMQTKDQTTKRIKVAVIGCGSVSNSYLPQLSKCPFVELVSTCDIKDCPTIYATDRGTLLVQGKTPTDHGLQIPAHETLVEIPVELIRKAVRDNLI